ncbi:hypothetical protein HHI36_011497, partial [Cryptolaemus montrouzieri]
MMQPICFVLKEEYNKWGLTINIKKTAFMVVDDEDEIDFDVGKYKLRNVKSFKYLGRVDGNIIDTIENKRLSWYGHLQRLEEYRLPKKIFKWMPPKRRKRGRPPLNWKKDVENAIRARGLEEGDYADRK